MRREEKSELVAERLRALGHRVELVTVVTEGDRRPIDLSPGVGVFVTALEQALADGAVDLAVHSAKDVPLETRDGLVVAAFPAPREDPRDVLVTAAGGATLDTLPAGARFGTDSPRRAGFVLHRRPDLSHRPLHGNVDTRLRTVAESARAAATRGLDAIVLAVAGLERLGERARISQTFSLDEMVPAVGQGIIAVQMRRDDRDMARVLSQIDDEATALEASCERAFAQRLGVDCYLPVGGCARASGAKARKLETFMLTLGSHAIAATPCRQNAIPSGSRSMGVPQWFTMKICSGNVRARWTISSA